MEKKTKIAANNTATSKDRSGVVKNEKTIDNNNRSGNASDDKDPYDRMVELAAAYGEQIGPKFRN